MRIIGKQHPSIVIIITEFNVHPPGRNFTSIAVKYPRMGGGGGGGGGGEGVVRHYFDRCIMLEVHIKILFERPGLL